MSLYSDIREGVMVWTNRPDMAAETDQAIKQALRAAHRADTFWRDLVTLRLTDVATDQLQQIDLSSVAPDMRKIATVGPTEYDLHYDGILATDLFDDYQFLKTNVYYGIGTALMIRAAAPVSNITLTYYRQPIVSPITAIDSWIADKHQDLVILWAASTVLTFIGETDIKSRVDALARSALADLIADNLSIEGK